MPKMKTHRGAAKRFKKTGSGRIRFKRAYMRHNMRSQQKSTKRVLRQAGYLSSADEKAVAAMLHGDH